MKINVNVKNKKDKIKASLLEKELTNFINQNKYIFNEYMEIVTKTSVFRLKWGIPVEIVIGEWKEKSKRQLGKN